MINVYIQKKLKFPLHIVFASAVLCGLMMGLVSTLSIVSANLTENAILGKVIYGIAFTGLLFLVLLNGYELFTGNTMLLTVVHKKVHTKKVLLNVLLVYVGNFIGCLAAAGLLYICNLHTKLNLTAYLQKLYTAKTLGDGTTGLTVWQMLITGFFANYLVCMGVYLGGKGKNSLETYINLFFPIAMFCILGFEHSVANMFSLFYAIFVNGNPVGPVFLNLLVVTVGNIAGGVCLALTTKVKDRILPAVSTEPVNSPVDRSSSDT